MSKGLNKLVQQKIWAKKNLSKFLDSLFIFYLLDILPILIE